MARVPQSKTSKSPYRVQVLDRALAALDVLAARSTECSLVEICTTLKLHKSTAHRLMMVLEQHRLVEKNPDTGRYRLGLKLFEFGSKAIGAIDLRRQARPYLDRLQRELGETVFLLPARRRTSLIPRENRVAAERANRLHGGSRAPAIARRLEKPCWRSFRTPK